MARFDPYKWLGAFRASLNEIVACGYSRRSQDAGLDILRRALDLDHGIGPGWEDAMAASAAAGFASGMEFMLDNAIEFTPGTLTKLRSRLQGSWSETLMKSDVSSPAFLALSPSGQHPPSVPVQMVSANHALMQRLHSAPGMPSVSWKEMYGLAINGNMALALVLVSGGKTEPLASPSSTKYMLQMVRYLRSQFALSDLMVAVQAPANWKPATLPQAVFAAWWNQAPPLAKRGDDGCAAILRMINSALVPNGYPALSSQTGGRLLLSALLLLERSGYTPQHVFRAAGRDLKTCLGALAITENEPETLKWLVARGLDLSGNGFVVERFPSSKASGISANSFWAAIIARLDLSSRRGGPEDIEGWWTCVHELMENPAHRLALRANVRNAKVSFGSEDVQARWESVIGHVDLQRTVDTLPDPVASAPPTRPAARF